jgi:hypothetical protein
VLSLFDCAPSAQQPYTRDGLDIHANQAETSILMHLRPEMVRADRLVDEPDVTPELVFSYDIKATTRSGVVGHARRASGEDGHALVELLVGELSAPRRSSRNGRNRPARHEGLEEAQIFLELPVGDVRVVFAPLLRLVGDEGAIHLVAHDLPRQLVLLEFGDRLGQGLR